MLEIAKAPQGRPMRYNEGRRLQALCRGPDLPVPHRPSHRKMFSATPLFAGAGDPRAPCAAALAVSAGDRWWIAYSRRRVTGLD